MIKRLFDIIFASIGLICLSPLLILVSMAIIANSGLPVLYRQVRIGRYGKEFVLLKFRTMHKDADQKGLLTVGGRDPRVTGVGYYLRKFKIDEFPQLFNVIRGDMSIVGPRPEVKKYVDMYSAEQRLVLDVRPGITDYASIKFVNENDILSQSENPENTYIQEVMPVKLKLNLKYIKDKSLSTDLGIIFETFKRILS